MLLTGAFLGSTASAAHSQQPYIHSPPSRSIGAHPSSCADITIERDTLLSTETTHSDIGTTLRAHRPHLGLQRDNEPEVLALDCIASTTDGRALLFPVAW